MVERRNNDICKLLHKSKREESPDLRAQREERDAAEATRRRKAAQDLRLQQKQEAEERRKAEEMKSYAGVFTEDRLVSNEVMLEKLERAKAEGRTESEAVRMLEDDFM